MHYGATRYAPLNQAMSLYHEGKRPQGRITAKGAFHLLCGTEHNKWNKIEHRRFCHITQNWRGRPLVSREVVVNLIGATTTQQGPVVRSALDENEYPLGRKVTDSELESLSIKRDKFHGEWNDHLSPRA